MVSVKAHKKEFPCIISLRRRLWRQAARESKNQALIPNRFSERTLRTKPSPVENWFNILNKYLFKLTNSWKGLSPFSFCVNIWRKLNTFCDIIRHRRELAHICLWMGRTANVWKKKNWQKRLPLSSPLLSYFFKLYSQTHKAKGNQITELLSLCCSQICWCSVATQQKTRLEEAEKHIFLCLLLAALHMSVLISQTNM